LSYTIFRDLVDETANQRRNFFKLVFGSATGFVCITYITPDRIARKVFFKWPDQLEEMLDNISAHSQQKLHAYFGVSLYEDEHGKRDKENVKQCTVIWVDLDTANPKSLLLRPSVLTETSPGKYQALWLLEDPVEPSIGEEISRKIAYAHADEGADKCWDSTHIFRIPYTPNFKYSELKNTPIVTILQAERTLYRPSDFDCYPSPKALQEFENKPIVTDTTRTVKDIVKAKTLPPGWEALYYEEPQGEWSGPLWALINLLEEGGLSPEDTFTIVNSAACNKYRRDNRPETELWRDINKAYIRRVERMKLAPSPHAGVPVLITKEELARIEGRKTFVEKYISWARNVTDAPLQYHQSGAFIILSSLLAGRIRLPTSYGEIIPNLWFMILGGTTLTRKTTSMNMALSLLYEVDEEALLATDGTVEGILVGLRDRPRQPSIFKRDEFTGLLEALAHKDYMAGFAEQLTQLYDGVSIKRLLRRETIDIRDPVFIMYVGGIKDKTQDMVTEELVMGGFIPRFIIISGELDVSRMQELGPPKPLRLEEREVLKNELIDLRNHYVKQASISRHGENIGRIQNIYEASLTPEAWKRYNQFETTLISSALSTGLGYLTPVCDRLAKSTLKAAMLIAASMQRKDRVVVTIEDLLHAISYAKGWYEYASEIVNCVGKTQEEKLITKIQTLVIRAGTNGVPRSEIMNIFGLDAKRADLLFRTMEQRMLIIKNDNRYYSMD
jgi:hypothetical protein